MTIQTLTQAQQDAQALIDTLTGISTLANMSKFSDDERINALIATNAAAFIYRIEKGACPEEAIEAANVFIAKLQENHGGAK